MPELIPLVDTGNEVKYRIERQNNLTMNCSLDFRWFPFDVQYLPIHIRALNSKWTTSAGGTITGSLPLKPYRYLFGVQPHQLAAWELDCSHITYDESNEASTKYWCDLIFVVEAQRAFTSYALTLIAFPFFLTLCVFAQRPSPLTKPPTACRWRSPYSSR